MQPTVAANDMRSLLLETAAELLLLAAAVAALTVCSLLLEAAADLVLSGVAVANIIYQYATC
jgi:hypothetical protein